MAKYNLVVITPEGRMVHEDVLVYLPQAKQVAQAIYDEFGFTVEIWFGSMHVHTIGEVNE